MLDEARIREFFEAGFTVLPGMFSATEVETMRRAFDRLRSAADGLRETSMHRGSQFVIERAENAIGGSRVRIHRVVWCGAAEPALLRFGSDARLLRLAGRLLGSTEMNQLINQAHFKLPGDGVEFPWHQDSTHRRFGQAAWTDVNGTGSYVQTVIALDDIDETNGPILFLPGSGSAGHLAGVRVDGMAVPPGLPGNGRVVTASMAAGSVLAFGPYVFHGSRPNTSTRPRRVLINGYASPGANRRQYPGAGAGRLLRVPAD